MKLQLDFNFQYIFFFQKRANSQIWFFSKFFYTHITALSILQKKNKHNFYKFFEIWKTKKKIKTISMDWKKFRTLIRLVATGNLFLKYLFLSNYLSK